MTDLQRMDKERKKRTERILNLTLEIIYLLTGEDYKVVKTTSCEYVTNSSLFCSSRGRVKRQSPVMESSPPSLIPERNNDKKILEVINKIIDLLTGEVPIRYQDVTDCSSVKKWEYMEGHKDLMMENRPALTSPDPRDTRGTQTDAKAKEEKETLVRIKEEDIPLEISTDGRYKMYTTKKAPLISLHGATREAVDSMEVNPIAPDVHSVLRIDYLSSGPRGGNLINVPCSAAHGSTRGMLVTNEGVEEEEEEEVHILFKEEEEEEEEEEIPPEISTDGETEDDGITPSSSEGNSTASNLHPVLQSADPSSRPSTNAGRFPNRPHHTARRGAKTFMCSECGQSFPERVELVVHQRTHTVEKPYACPECGKCYSQKALLKRHQKAHTGEKPHSCSECGKCFSHSQYLVLHQRSHTGEKPYSCHECGKCFFRSDHLIRHRRFHTGEKPYSCSECGKCFAVRFCLTEHERIHTGERPYSCSECGKGFTSKSNLASHARVHTGHHPYSCSECGKRFSKKSYLMTHLGSHWGQEAPISECDT